MKKILSLGLIAIVSVLASCGQKSAKPNAVYVKAAQDVMEARVQFDKANYDLALSLCQSANEKIDRILSDFPDSEIALKIVSDDTIKLGTHSYADLKERILPRLNRFCDVDLKPLGVAWIVSGDDNIKGIAELVIAKKTQDKILLENGYTLKNAMDNAALTKAFVAIMEYSENGVNDHSLMFKFKSSIESLDTKEVKQDSFLTPVTNPPRVVLDVDKLFSKARTEASLVVYEMDASNKILEYAKEISYDENLSAKFVDIMLQAMANAEKITLKERREEAYCTLSKAFANIYASNKALDVASHISNPQLRLEAMNEIAFTLAQKGKYEKALDVVKQMTTSPAKDSFAQSLALGFAKQGQTQQAVAVASMANSPEVRNNALAQIAALSASVDKVTALKILENIDPTYLSDESVKELIKSLRVQLLHKYLTESPYKVAAILEIADMLPNTKTIEWLNAMLPTLSSIEAGKDFSSLLHRFSLLLCDVGFEDSVLEFIKKHSHKASPEALVETFCDVGLRFVLKDKKEKSFEIFKRAYLLAENPDSKLYLAWTLNEAGFSAEEFLPFVQKYLPKF